MSFRRRVLATLVGIFILGLPLITQAADSICAKPKADESQTSSTLVMVPEITLPGFSAGSQVTISATTIGEYVKSVFILFIWAVGVLAVVMITFGGVKWVAAAGNTSRIGDAKDMITNSIIGLIIALTSVLLLYIINPDLTIFPSLNVIDVKRCVAELPNAYKGENNEGLTCLNKAGQTLTKEATCAIYTTGSSRGSYMLWPVEKIPGADPGKTIVSDYGPRDVSVGSKCHAGVDIRTATNKGVGLPIVAVAAGTVTDVGTFCNEKTVQLSVAAGTNTKAFHVRYVHLASVSVLVGDRVTGGQMLGVSGGDPKYGCVTGPHLHFSMYVDGNENGTVHDPEPCLTQSAVIDSGSVGGKE